jgi:SAM-dependent MidA family methyltransferase
MPDTFPHHATRPERPRVDTLPEPEADALAHSAHLQALIAGEIAAAGGQLPFDRFMELALYAPGLGYYVAGASKLGGAGDFVTAPEISPLFARCLAVQCGELLDALGGGDVLEFGAGSGVLAAELLKGLAGNRTVAPDYYILELSPELRDRQRATLAERVPELLARVHWLDRLPRRFRGAMIGNEVLDAMPVHRFGIADGAVVEGCVVAADGRLAEAWLEPRSPGLVDAVNVLERAVGPLPEGYRSEINLRLQPWLNAVAASLVAGGLLLVDYGYPRADYYRAERRTGTLLCHYRHRVHAEPLLWPGLQDITASVDFSAVALAAQRAGLELAGYTTQAAFLLSTGLDRFLGESDPLDVVSHLTLVQGAKTLTLPGEMGERFKVIGLAKGLDHVWSGFAFRDLSDRL